VEEKGASHFAIANTQLCSFIGAVNYYRDMWPSQAGVLAPLTALSGDKKRAKISWTKDCEVALLTTKALILSDTLLAYPDYNQPFTIDTDASDYQMGAVIHQNRRPVAIGARNLTQHNATTPHTRKGIIEYLGATITILLTTKISPLKTSHRSVFFAGGCT
jgi:hypothetical protein